MCRSDDTHREVCSHSTASVQRPIFEIEHAEVTLSETVKSVDSQMRKIAKMLTLSIVYASNIGGTATLTGTPTNLFITDAINRSAHSWLSVAFKHIVISR